MKKKKKLGGGGVKHTAIYTHTLKKFYLHFYCFKNDYLMYIFVYTF